MSLRHSFLVLVSLLVSVAGACAQNSLDPSIAAARSGRIGIVHAMGAPSTGIVLTIRDSINATEATTIVCNEKMPGRGITGAIAAGANDAFLVVWEQNAGATSQLWCAQYTPAGKQLGTTTLVTDSIAVNGKSPRIAAGADGRFVVAWQDYRTQVPNLMYQLFGADLRKIGQNQLLAAYPGIPVTPVPAISRANEIAFAYQHTLKDTFHVCVRFARWNRKPGKVTIVDRANNRAYSTNPDLVWLGEKELVVVWKDYRTRISDIYLQRLTREGRLLGTNVKVNDDTTILWQRLPRIAANDSLVCVVWEDYRNDPRNQMGDIYCQWYRRSGTPVLRNLRVNTSDEPTHQSAPAVCLAHGASATIVWCDAQGDTVVIAGRSLGVGEEGRSMTTTGGARTPYK